MGYFLTDIKKLYCNKSMKLMLIFLMLVMLGDPISVYLQYGRDQNFINQVGLNGFQFWLLMNSRSWGFNVYNSLFLAFAVLSTSLVFFNEKHSSMYEYLLLRGSKKNYYFSKVISTFLVTFFNFTILLLLNVAMTYTLFPYNAELTEIYTNYVPKIGMFAYPFYQSSPIIMVIVYVVLNAVTVALFALLSLAIHMLVSFKNKYIATLGPFIMLYLITHIISLVLGAERMNYNLKIIIQPMVAALGTTRIDLIDVFIVLGFFILIDLIFLCLGYMRNKDVL